MYSYCTMMIYCYTRYCILEIIISQKNFTPIYYIILYYTLYWIMLWCVVVIIMIILLALVDPIEKHILLEYFLCSCMCVSRRVEVWDALGSRQACWQQGWDLEWKLKLGPWKTWSERRGRAVCACVCGWIYSAKLNIVLINLGTGACVLKATPFHLGYVWRRRLEIRPRLLSADRITLASANPSHRPNTKP